MDIDSWLFSSYHNTIYSAVGSSSALSALSCPTGQWRPLRSCQLDAKEAPYVRSTSDMVQSILTKAPRCAAGAAANLRQLRELTVTGQQPRKSGGRGRTRLGGSA